MKKRFLLPILVLICTVMLLSACGSKNKTVENNVPNGTESRVDNTESTEPSSDSGEESEESDGISISVTPPEGWEPAEYTIHFAEYWNGTASFMVMKEYFNASKLDEVVRQAKSAFPGSFKNIEYIGETESITIGGKDARKLIFTCDGGTTRVKYWYIFFMSGKEPYSVHFVDTIDSFETLTEDYEQILKSISFKND